jgi:selenocysteine lyase/cysteine desulfurase
LGNISKEYELAFLVDAAATAGLIEIDMESMGIDYLACSGHKLLYGPQGTGLLLVRRELPLLEPWMSGATAIDSAEYEMPLHLPERLEAGTLNSVGIIGLGAALDVIENVGREHLRSHSNALLRFLQAELSEIQGVSLYGPGLMTERVPILAFNVGFYDSRWTALQLFRRFGITVRAGLHSAPLAHRSAGTIDSGAVRVSLGQYNSIDEMKTLIEAIYLLSKES